MLAFHRTRKTASHQTSGLILASYQALDIQGYEKPEILGRGQCTSLNNETIRCFNPKKNEFIVLLIKDLSSLSIASESVDSAVFVTPQAWLEKEKRQHFPPSKYASAPQEL